MKTDEYKQKRDMAEAMLWGGGFALVVIFALLLCSCASVGVAAPPGPDQFVGQVELVTESDDVCLLRIIALPHAIRVRRLHLGTWQDYVANVPRGWPLPYEVSRWPMLVPNTCDGAGLCQWLDARDKEDCAELLRLGAMGVEVGAQ